MLPTDELTMGVTRGRDHRRASGDAPRPRVYLSAALVTTALAVVGFWPTYFGRIVSGSVGVPSVIHLHAAVFITWLMLFVVQVVFAATGRIRLHMRVGRWVMAYGLIVICAGLMAISEGFTTRLATGDVFRAQRWLFGTLRDLVFFAPFLAAGWIYRRYPEIHKRLMIVATVILVLPAVSRMTFLGTPVPLWKFMLVWPVPVYIAMIHDFRTRKLVHPVYVIGIAAMLTMRLVLPIGSSQLWQTAASWITAIYETPISPVPH